MSDSDSPFGSQQPNRLMAANDPTQKRDDTPVQIIAHRLQQSGGKAASADSRPRAGASANGPAPQAQNHAQTTGMRQVVLVDRDVDALRDIAVALRDQFDFHVTISGHEALALLQSGTIDIIVVGQTLYSSTGIAVLGEARRRAPHVQRVLLANAAEAMDIERYAAPAVPFRVLQRPFTPLRLLELLETPEAEPPTDPAIRQEPIAAKPPAPAPAIKPAPPKEPLAVAPRPQPPSQQQQPIARPRMQAPIIHHDDYEHVVLETPPEPRRRRPHRPTAEEDLIAANLPIVVYTDNGEFYHAVCAALQDAHEVRLATQLEAVVEMAEMGGCPILITDRAGTQTELQRISIALRAAESALVTIASGSPGEGLALRKLLNTPALYSFLPKPLSAPLVRLTVESAKRHYIELKTPSEPLPESESGIAIATTTARPASQRLTAYQPNQIFNRNFDIEDRFDFRRLLPYAGIAALALVVIGGGAWYWQYRAQSQARTAVLMEAELELAQRAYDAGDYVTPENANALYFYRRVLKRDPAQEQAVHGVDNVVERLIEQTERQLTEDKLDAAEQSIALVRELRPDHKRIDFLEGQVRKANSYRQAQRLAEQSAQVARDEAAKATAANAQLIQRAAETNGTIGNSTQRSQAVNGWLTTARQRLTQARLVTPESDSAEYYFRLAERADPNNVAVEQGLREIGTRLLADAQDALSKQQLDLARRRLADAGRFGPDPAVVTRMQGEISAAADAGVRNNFMRLALQRTRENALFEPAQDSAKYYLSQLQRFDQNGADVQQVTRAIALKLVENANQATAQRQFNTAIRLLEEARRLGFTGAEWVDANNKLQAARNPAPPPPQQRAIETQPPPPKVVKSVAAKFPDDAMAARVSGWVDVSFKINAAGDVYDAAAIASNPAAGSFAPKFERAAVAAISQYKFEARNISDTQTQSMVVRVQFKLQ